MLTEKDYCDYDTQKSLMELGFPMKAQSYDLGKGVKEYLPKIHLYDAQKWLREEKGIIVGIINNFTTHEFDFYVSTWEEDRCRGNKYSSYEDALQRGIKEAIKILKNEDK